MLLRFGSDYSLISAALLMKNCSFSFSEACFKNISICSSERSFIFGLFSEGLLHYVCYFSRGSQHFDGYFSGRLYSIISIEGSSSSSEKSDSSYSSLLLHSIYDPDPMTNVCCNRLLLLLVVIVLFILLPLVVI